MVYDAPSKAPSHPELPGSDLPQTEVKHASQKAAGWDPPTLPGSPQGKPQAQHQSATSAQDQSQSLPAAAADRSSRTGLGSDLDKMQTDRAGYKPPSMAEPEVQLGTKPVEVLAQDEQHSDAQGGDATLPQHQMPGVPGDLVPPGIPPQSPPPQESRSASKVQPDLLKPQGAQSGQGFVQAEQLPKSAKGYWAGRVPGTPVSHADD